MTNINYKKYKKLDDEELKNEFFKAKKDPNFKKLIDSLPLSEDELYKYTSSLKKVVFEKQNDVENNHYPSEKNEIPGFVFNVKVVDNKLLFYYDACEIKKEELKEIEYVKNGYYFEVSKNIRNAKMSDIYTDDKNRVELIKWITKFIKEYREGKTFKGLYLSGNFGSGKSYIISACLNEIAKNDKKAAMIYFPEFLRSLKTSFNSDFDEQFNYARKADILLLDDIGAENVSSWSRDEILGPILQYRMDEKLPTFFTSNLSIDELEVHLSESKEKVDKLKAKRIIERIKFLTDDLKLISSNKRN